MNFCLIRDEILKANTRVKPGLCVCLDPSKAQVKTRVLDGLKFSKNQPSWVFLSVRLESSSADDRKFRKIFYICAFKKKHTMKIMYLHKVWIFEIHLLVTADLMKFCLQQRESLLISLSLVESEPILTWVLSKPEFGFYSGLSF